MSISDRFWEKVLVAGEDECWEWTASLDSYGYGQIGVNGRLRLAHRLSWELKHGIALEKHIGVLHSCDNRRCVNPRHLSLGDQFKNMRDMVARGRNHPHLGSRNGNSRLTEDQVRQIRAAYVPNKRGSGAPAIARRFGVDTGTVVSVIKGKTWGHVK